MDKHQVFQLMMSILTKMDEGIKDIDADCLGLDYDDFKQITDLLRVMKFIDGPDTFYDGLLNYETAYITDRGRGYLEKNS